jgi:formylglycine-generating enzyme required for sulfatase activity
MAPGEPDVTRASEAPTQPDPLGTVVGPGGATVPEGVGAPRPDPSGTIATPIEQQARLASAAATVVIGTVPGFEIEGELGRGGMGVVYRATQTGLGRTVALKMLLAGPYADPALRGRFLLEAESVAALEHPHIIRVFAFGEAGGHPYLAMEFLPGGSLSERIKARGPFPVREAAELVAALAEAVAHAHSRGIVHRDIKPANVLLTAAGELRLADFGLAKVGRADLSVTGQVLGTPAYMAPEQAAGKIHEVGTAADVYALGAVLYDLLTGRPPFQGDSAMVTLQKVLTLEPPGLRTLRADIPRDLETICLKCLAKSPNKRYATAETLAADLRAFLGGRPIAARPVSAAERAWKWVKRNPGRAGVLAAAVLVVLGGVGAALEVRAQREADHRAADEEVKRRQRETQAGDLVKAIASADTAEVPRLIGELNQFRDLAAPQLRTLTSHPVSSKAGLHVRLALLDEEPDRAAELAGYLPACRPEELLPLRQFLAPHSAAVAPVLWAVLVDPKGKPGERVRSACALASLDPNAERWTQVAASVVDLVVQENPLQAVIWEQALDPVRIKLLPHLLDRYRTARERIRSGKLDESALVAEALAFDLAVNLLARYAADRPMELVELAATVDARHYGRISESLRENKAAVVPLLTAELQKTVGPGGKDGPAPAELEAAGKRRGYAAAALVALGAGEPVRPMFRFPADGDPTARSYLSERLARISADPRSLMQWFDAETDVSAKGALLVALGDFPPETVPAAEKNALTARLLVSYREHPDPGLHGAIDWLLRQKWGKGNELAAIDLALAREARMRVLARALAGIGGIPIEPLLPPPPVARGRDWFINGEGQTFAVVRPPVEFTMGSPPAEPDRDARREPAHKKRITRTFALATREVTVAEFLRFRPDHKLMKEYSAGPDTPNIRMTWYEAAEYCNWLSAREGIPPDQWCYEPNRFGDFAEGMRIRAGHLNLTGYRLPSEAEWEYACRARTTTERYYGRGTELLGRYGWFFYNSGEHARPVGLLRPNELGLFDMLGNVNEFIGGQAFFYDTTELEDVGEAKPVAISERALYTVRGGSFFWLPKFLRAADRRENAPGERIAFTGLRPARTLLR